MNSPSPRQPARTLLAAGLIVAAVAWVFAPAMHGMWLWDDQEYITQNRLLRSVAGLGRIWTGSAGVNYFPLTSTVQWVQWHLWKDNPFGYHLTNIALHALGALLAWRLFSRLGVRQAWLGGLLFAVHPLTAESVAWVSEIKNTLSLPLLLLAADCYVRFDQRPEPEQVRAFAANGTYVASLALFLAALLSKSTVAMFPLVLLLYVWWKRGRIAKSDVAAVAPFFALSLGLGLVTVEFEHSRSIGRHVLELGGFLPRAAGAGLAILFYAFKSLFPVGLSPIYPRWPVNPPRPWEFLPWPVLGLAFAWMWNKRKTGGRHALLGTGFFLASLAPVLGFVPMAYLRIAQVADHFAYISLIAVAGLAAAGTQAWNGRLGRSLQTFAIGILACVCVWFAILTHRYAAVFHDEKTLWTYTLARDPASWQARNNLGNKLLNDGRLEEAIAEFKEALRLNPSDAEAHDNLGCALSRQHRLDEAIDQYRQALEIDPGYPQALNNLGSALADSGRLDEAVGKYEAALALKPEFAEACNNLGTALAQAGRAEKAAGCFARAVALEPDYAEAHDNLGVCLVQLRRVPEAIAQFETAVRLRPDDADARSHLEAARRIAAGQR
jgi:tetratricopeptide (TPR) repeat protein